MGNGGKGVGGGLGGPDEALSGGPFFGTRATPDTGQALMNGDPPPKKPAKRKGDIGVA